jgi:hypothetical protein
MRISRKTFFEILNVSKKISSSINVFLIYRTIYFKNKHVVEMVSLKLLPSKLLCRVWRVISLITQLDFERQNFLLILFCSPVKIILILQIQPLIFIFCGICCFLSWLILQNAETNIWSCQIPITTETERELVSNNMVLRSKHM